MNKIEQSGFSILEVMISIAILAVGLLGAAAMQTRAIHSNHFAGVLTEKTSVAEEWMEWLINFSRQNYTAGGDSYNGYELLAALDENPAAGTCTEKKLTCGNAETLKKELHAWGLRPPAGEFFDDFQLPKLPGRSYPVSWRIDANFPLQNTTTIRVETREGGQAVSLVFLICSAM